MLFQIRHVAKSNIPREHGQDGRFQAGVSLEKNAEKSTIGIYVTRILIATEKNKITYVLRMKNTIRLIKYCLLLSKGLKIKDGHQFDQIIVHSTQSTYMQNRTKISEWFHHRWFYPEFVICITGYSGYGLCQWETTLQCNIVSHWQSPYPEWFFCMGFSGPELL